MPVIYGAIDLSKNELRNAVVQNLASAPLTPAQGQIYYDTVAHILYWHNGTTWVPAQSGGSLTAASTVTSEAVGDAPVVGVATNYAREDHKHGREAFGVITAQTAFGAASGNGVAATVTRSDHTHGTPVHDNAAHSGIALSALGAPTGSVTLNGQVITNLATPVAGTDATNKNYVDNAIAGLSWKDAARAASTANIASLSAPQTVDGVALIANDRVLVKNQTTASANGLYTVQAGAWVRATDADVAAEIEGMAIFVNEGTVNGDTSWVCTANAPITVGTTNLTFSQFSGAGTINAGNGLLATGNTFDFVAGDTTLTVAADSAVVNTAVIATVASVTAGMVGVTKKYAAALTGTASPEVITHNLNTRDVHVTVLNGASPYTAIELEWDATTVNTVTIRYNPNLGAGYRIVVVG